MKFFSRIQMEVTRTRPHRTFPSVRDCSLKIQTKFSKTSTRTTRDDIMQSMAHRSQVGSPRRHAYDYSWASAWNIHEGVCLAICRWPVTVACNRLLPSRTAFMHGPWRAPAVYVGLTHPPLHVVRHTMKLWSSYEWVHRVMHSWIGQWAGGPQR